MKAGMWIGHAPRGRWYAHRTKVGDWERCNDDQLVDDAGGLAGGEMRGYGPARRPTPALLAARDLAGVFRDN
jgi:hypothetical protein